MDTGAEGIGIHGGKGFYPPLMIQSARRESKRRTKRRNSAALRGTGSCGARWLADWNGAASKFDTTSLVVSRLLFFCPRHPKQHHVTTAYPIPFLLSILAFPIMVRPGVFSSLPPFLSFLSSIGTKIISGPDARAWLRLPT